jgi:hypothetical protein
MNAVNRVSVVNRQISTHTVLACYLRCLFLFASTCLSGCCTPGGEWEYKWHTGFEAEPSASDTESFRIPRELIFQLPEASVQSAIAMLSQEPVVAMQSPDVERMLGRSMPDTDALLSQIASNAVRMAEERMSLVRNPFYSPVRGSLAAEVETLKRTAKFVNERKGRLRPFLVRAVELGKGRGGFEAWQRNDYLWIQHSCLTRRRLRIERCPIVIFLEAKPSFVFVRVSAAE